MTKPILVFLMMLFLSSQNAHAIEWTAGDPTQNGTDQFRITKSTGGTVLFAVDLNATDDDKEKARKVLARIEQLRSEGINGSLEGITRPDDGPTLKFPATITGFKTEKNETKEKDKMSSFVPHEGVVDYHNAPTGLATDGTESIFQASFEFSISSSEIFADSNLTFSSLSSPTVNGLLTDTFNEFLADLPAAFDSNLHLDLANEQIIFAFPQGATNAFVTNFTSDLSTESTVGISEVPEPSTLLLLGTGLVGLIGFGKKRINVRIHKGRQMR